MKRTMISLHVFASVNDETEAGLAAQRIREVTERALAGVDVVTLQISTSTSEETPLQAEDRIARARLRAAPRL